METVLLRDVPDGYLIVEDTTVVDVSINPSDATENFDGEIELYWTSNYAEYNLYFDYDAKATILGNVMEVADRNGHVHTFTVNRIVRRDVKDVLSKAMHKTPTVFSLIADYMTVVYGSGERVTVMQDMNTVIALVDDGYETSLEFKADAPVTLLDDGRWTAVDTSGNEHDFVAYHRVKWS